jgi:uncharacterized protein (DUF1015 family)
VVLIKPFQALHPISGNAKEIACFPYDVTGESEAREFVQENPTSFLRVTRPEVEFPNRVRYRATRFYLQASEISKSLLPMVRSYMTQNLQFIFIDLRQPRIRKPAWVACCSLDEYQRGLIKKHERTRPDKVSERTKHMVELRAQTGLILVAFKGNEATQETIRNETSGEPIFQFTCGSNIKHTAWRVGNQAAVTNAFAGLDSLYIADGHHRIEAALNARNILRERNGAFGDAADYEFVMAGMFRPTSCASFPITARCVTSAVFRMKNSSLI